MSDEKMMTDAEIDEAFSNIRSSAPWTRQFLDRVADVCAQAKLANHARAAALEERDKWKARWHEQLDRADAIRPDSDLLADLREVRRILGSDNAIEGAQRLRDERDEALRTLELSRGTASTASQNTCEICGLAIDREFSSQEVCECPSPRRMA